MANGFGRRIELFLSRTLDKKRAVNDSNDADSPAQDLSFTGGLNG
jgi:hypothetical protein